MRDMPVLVVGTGLIGSVIAGALRARGAEVTCADADQARARSAGALLGCAAVHLDITNTAQATAVVGQVRPAIVVHAAGRFSARPREEARRLVLDSARGTASLAAAATAARVGRLLLVSSLAVYANPRGAVVETSRTGGRTPYGLAKSAAESALLAGCAGTEMTPLIVRLSGVYGGAATVGGWLNTTLRGLVDTALRGDQVRIPAFLGGHEYLHVRDAAAGAIQVAEHGRAGAYNIGTSRPLDATAVASAFAPLGAAVTCEEEDGPAPHWWLDTRKARTELGFEAGLSLADGLRIWADEITAERMTAEQVTAQEITAEQAIHEEVPMIGNTRPLRIMVIVGSVRAGSRTRAAAGYAAAHVIETGNEALVWDPHKLPLPIADPDYHDDPLRHPNPTVRAFVTSARRADGFILTTPVYHNSYSGVLKNALDNLTIEEFADKPVGLLSHGPKLTAIQACDQLRIVVRGLYGLCVANQAVTTPPDFDGSPSGPMELTDGAMRTRISGMVDAVLKLARR